MEFIYSTAILSIIATGINMFYNNLYLSIITVFFLLITVLGLVKVKHKWKGTLQREEFSRNEELEREKEKSNATLISAEAKISEAEGINKENRRHLLSIHRLLTELDLTTPIIEKLSKVIINKSEESTLNATEKIFTIVEESQTVSKDIQTLLSNMSEGDHSLDMEMERFMSEIEKFQEIVVKVEQLKKSYISDMGLIENTVRNIKSLADGISDIADQTSILAINASIEAARAGSAGAGFAVIAGETQKLASDSKIITKKITDGIKEIGRTVTSSFQRQSETLSDTVNHLQEAKNSFYQMTHELAPQIKNIGPSVKRSRDLSESVTARLNEITMSLQYQDATRQILEHIVKIVEAIQKEYALSDIQNGLGIKENRELINSEILAKASKIFTVREEWIALGLTLEENQLEEAEEKENFQSDITLF